MCTRLTTNRRKLVTLILEHLLTFLGLLKNNFSKLLRHLYGTGRKWVSGEKKIGLTFCDFSSYLDSI